MIKDKFSLVCAVSAITLCAFGLSAPAMGSTLNLRLADNFAETIPLGQEKESVFQWLHDRIQQTHGPRLKRALDQLQRESVRRDIALEFQTLKDSLITLDGRRSGYEVSIVADEFLPGAGQSLLVYREGAETHHLIFVGNTLWKYARSLSTPVPFAQTVRKIERTLGPPSPSAGAKGKPDEPPSVVTWQGDRKTLRLVDHRILYKAVLLVVEDRATAILAEEALRGSQGSSQPATGVIPELEGFIDTEEDQ